MQLNPYLNFDGCCEAAFKFYEKVLGGKIEAMMPHAGSPMEPHVPAEWRDKIMHARLVLGQHERQHVALARGELHGLAVARVNDRPAQESA